MHGTLNISLFTGRNRREKEKKPIMIILPNTLYNNHITYELHLTQEELQLLRFDCSMALAFSQYDKYQIFDDILTLTEQI